MKEKNKTENLPFKNLPDNDFYYLVLNYCAAVKLKNESLIPNIQVILRKVNINNLTFIKDSHDIVVYLPIPELDEVRIGSVWKRRKKVLDRWNFFDTLEYMEDVSFNFDFTIHNPQIVKFNEEIDSLGDSLSNIYKINFEKSEEKNIPIFNKTNYTKLISDNGITVLFPSIELFVSAYTPQHKIIKQRLLQFNLDAAIDEFIMDNSKVENQEYHIGLHKKMEDSNIKFLAYSKFNNISRNRISNLYSSLEFNSGDTISGYQVRYPIVLPYHPIHLFISSDGLWLNEKTFLIQRIYIINIPSDITVKAIVEGKIHKVEKKFYKPEKKESKPKIIENEEENQDHESVINHLLEITNITGMDSNKQPRGRKTINRIQTQVNTIDDNKPKIQILNNEETKTELVEDSGAEDNKQIDVQNDQETPKKNKENKENVENVDGSDAEKLPSGDNSKQIKYLTSHSDIETNILLNQIIEILNIFKIEQTIINYKFLDKDFKELDEFKKTTFYETLLNNGFDKKNLEDSWYKLKKRENGKLEELGYREYFLIGIKLFDKYCYLLEIGKKESESSYLGVIFRDSDFNKLSNDKLLKIIKKIVENEGNYSKKDPSITDVKKLKAVDLGVKYKTYTHKFDKKLNKFIKLENILRNKIRLLNHLE